MDYLKVANASVMKNGNNLDQLSWLSIEKTFRQIFKGSEPTIKVCSSEIKTPREEEREAVIREYHESAVDGHRGASKSYWRIRADYYWEGMRNDVGKFIREYKSCQENKLVRSKTRLPMKITDTPSEPFEKVQMDIVRPLPETERGNKYILTFQDNFSKYSDAAPLKTIDSVTIACTLAEQFITRFGCPRNLHTDQGSNFISQIMQTICKIFKITKIESTAFYPESLGSLEWSHHSLVEYLKQFGNAQHWDTWLRYAILSYNTSVHETTGFHPHTLIFGKEANIPFSFERGEKSATYVEYLDHLLRKLSDTQSKAVERLKAAKWKSKQYYDRKINNETFIVGEHAYLLEEPCVSKFDPQYVGRYKIIQLVGERNAEIEIGNNRTKIVHLDKLKHAAIPGNE